MKYLGIDFGTKKLGLANSDDDNKLAFPMMICVNDIKHNNGSENKCCTLYNDILEIVRAYKITTIVIGESIDNSGKLNPVAKFAREFADNLQLFLNRNLIDKKVETEVSELVKNESKVEIKFEKEWYSSQEARRVDGERDVDDRAAAIILQRYLDRMNGPIDHIDSDEEED